MKHKVRGFTIVELLIVIVIIAILATITLVAYNGIQQRAKNTMAASELEDWKQVFLVYQAQNGSYPSMATGSYCLGTGGMTGGACWNGSTYPSADLTTALKTVSNSLPNGIRSSNGSHLGAGPIVDYNASGSVTVWTFFNGTDSCPANTTQRWRGTDSYACNSVLPSS